MSIIWKLRPSATGKAPRQVSQSAYQLKIDFGALGTKNSSAQITDLYQKEDLLGKQDKVTVGLDDARIDACKFWLVRFRFYLAAEGIAIEVDNKKKTLTIIRLGKRGLKA